MSIFRRMALAIRSYLATAEDRIESIAAAEEAREAASRKRALEEMRELQDSASGAVRDAGQVVVTPAGRAPSAALSADYRLLGLSPSADLAAVEEAWRRLASRADPKRFPAGSEEERRAAEILKSINEAYERIREALIPTEGRFGQLEL